MTWKTHKLATATVVLAITGNPIWTFLATMGSVTPDALEFILYGHDVPYWKHRKITHWPIPYLLSAIVFYLIMVHLPLYHALNSLSFSGSLSSLNDFISILKDFDYPLSHAVPLMGFWFSVGALFHIMEDALSGKVPLLNPKRKTFGVRLIRTRSGLESLFFVCLLPVFALVIKWKLGA